MRQGRRIQSLRPRIRRGTPRDVPSSLRRDPDLEPGPPGLRGCGKRPGSKGGGVEVIVVDDGSTDDTADVIERRFGQQIKLLRMPHRGGAGAARNAGVSQATGELLAFLDSDDLWFPGKLDAELDVLEQFPDAEAIVSDSKFIVDGQFRPRQPVRRKTAPSPRREAGPDGWRFPMALDRSP